MKKIMIQIAGEPNTGKTTIAAMIGRMLFNQGIRPEFVGLEADEARIMAVDEITLNERLKGLIPNIQFGIEQIQLSRPVSKPAKEPVINDEEE